jgi:hypothetical protein
MSTIYGLGLNRMPGLNRISRAEFDGLWSNRISRGRRVESTIWVVWVNKTPGLESNWMALGLLEYLGPLELNRISG